VNLISQDRHCKLLEEYITQGDDNVDWLQWATAEESKNLKGCFVNVHVLNLVHLDHENIQ